MLSKTIHGDKHLVHVRIAILHDILQARLNVSAALRVRLGLERSLRRAFRTVPNLGSAGSALVATHTANSSALERMLRAFPLDWAGAAATGPLVRLFLPAIVKATVRYGIDQNISLRTQVVALIVAGALLVDGSCYARDVVHTAIFMIGHVRHAMSTASQIYNNT